MIITTTLRPIQALSIRIIPAFFAPCSTTAAPFSTTTRPAKIQRTTAPFYASKAPSTNTTPTHISTIVRFASTVPPASSTTPSSHPSPSAPQPSPTSQLTWNRFLELRRTRRRISVAASSISAVATTYIGLTIFVRGSYDGMLAATMGLDPIVVTGMSAFAMMGVGWLIGPVFGGMVFNVLNRGVRGEVERKEKAFYDRIKAHRVDPTSSSIANPVPDYYGEKIGSVGDYRKWLKDQRAFNLKRGAYAGRKSVGSS